MRLIACYGFQILGLLLITAAGWNKKRTVILALVFCANFCSVLVMLLAGRYDGAAANVVCTVRAFLYIFKDKYRTNRIFWGCITATILVGVLAYQSPLSILVLIAPAVITTTNWFGSVKVIKIGTLISDLCWSVFDLASGVYVEAAKDLTSAGSNIAGLMRLRRGETEA